MKNLPAKKESWVRSLGREDPLKEEMASPSGILWASPVAQTGKSLPAVWETRVHSLGQEGSPGEGNGNPLQYPCLENSVDEEPCVL